MLTVETFTKGFTHPFMRKILTVLVFLTCAALLVINEINFRATNLAFDEAATARRVNLQLQSLMLAVSDAESTQRSYLLTGDERYQADFIQHMSDIDTQSAQLSTRVQVGVRDSVDALLAHVRDKQKIMGETVAMQMAGDVQGWQRIVQSGAGRELMRKIQAQGAHVIAFNNLRLKRFDVQARQSLQIARLAMAGMLLFAVGMIILIWRQTVAKERREARVQQMLEAERIQLEKTVEQRTESLRRLAAHLQLVREDERARLARELHDELGALLTTAKLDVARLRSRVDKSSASAQDTLERLAHLAQILSDGVALKRRIIEDLTPSALSNLGLVPALENLTRDHAGNTGMAVVTRLEPVQLGKDKALTVYRLVQEALTNCSKYARASRITVDLWAEGDTAHVRVCDDGCGFDTSQLATGSHGLAGMQYRVETQRGSIQVDSSPGNGTTISVQLPQDPAPEGGVT